MWNKPFNKMDDNIYSVNITKPPSYLRTLINSDEEIVLVYSKVSNCENIDESALSTSILDHSAAEASNFNTTGSPLKYSFENSALMCMTMLDCQQNYWLKDEEKHYPLTLEEARKFITEYLASNHHSKPVWCVCDGQDMKKTVLLSVQAYPTSVTRNIVTIDDYFPANKPKSKNRFQFNSMPSHSRQRKSSSIYQIFGARISEENQEDRQLHGYVSLEVLQENSASEKAFMTVQAIVGHDSALSSFFWRDLVQIELYMNTLTQYRCQEISYSELLPMKRSDSLNDDLVELSMQIVHNNNQRLKQNSDQVNDLDTIITSVVERSTLDITDQLWCVLIHCSTYGMLIHCLKAFVSEVAYNQNKVYIEDNNKCFMAELLRGIIDGKIAVPTFYGTQPIEILIELGIEKLRKDYVYIYHLGGIANEIELNDLFKSKLNSDGVEKKSDFQPKCKRTMILMPETAIINLNSIEHELKVLGQLETLLETLTLVPSNWMHYVTEQGFNYFLGEKSSITSFNSLVNNRLHEFIVELPISGIQQYIEKTKLVSRSKTTIMDSQWQKVKTIQHESLQPIFPPCIYKNDPIKDDDDNTEKLTAKIAEELCYCTSLLSITNVFGYQKEKK